MSLTPEQRAEVEALVSTSLDEAEGVWDQHGQVFETSRHTEASHWIAKRAEVVPSRIPDHPLISSDQSEVAEYVCLVADMRDSSKHLMVDYSQSDPTFTLMKRVYFETAALLPALDQTVQFEAGSVTEYLGDGIMALFSVNPDNRGPDIKSAHRAAQNCIGETRGIVNSALAKRYKLPSLDLGVGLGFGNGIVQLVGVPSRKHPKVLGPCVYYATKLSAGRNMVLINESLRQAWPSSKRGKIKFTATASRGVDAYRVG